MGIGDWGLGIGDWGLGIGDKILNTQLLNELIYNVTLNGSRFHLHSCFEATKLRKVGEKRAAFTYFFQNILGWPQTAVATGF